MNDIKYFNIKKINNIAMTIKVLFILLFEISMFNLILNTEITLENIVTVNRIAVLSMVVPVLFFIYHMLTSVIKK